MSLASAVERLSNPRIVRRRSSLVYDGTSPFPVASPSEVTATVKMHLQRGRPTQLVRALDGDESTGQARVWVSDKQLSKAFTIVDDEAVVLGWTGLQIAPAEGVDGPPGDLIEWEGRIWEVIEYQGWDESFTGKANFHRYLAEDRGSAS